MYNIRLYDQVPAPKPASTDYIVAAHYYPSWVKGATDLHTGFDGLHDYPERTPLCGYYDGNSPEFYNWEIKWALEHGVNCFIYCWYRYKDNFGKPVHMENLRLAESLHEGLFKSEYGNQMKFALMFETQPRWSGTDRKDLLENLMPFWIENYFKRDNYLKIDNKPVMFLYDTRFQVRDAFANAAAQKEAFDACREMAKQYGFNGMIFAAEDHRNEFERLDDMRARGYDFSFAYAWQRPKADPLTDEKEIAQQMKQMNFRAKNYPDFFVPTASAMWDPEPRFVTMPNDYKRKNPDDRFKLQPENFRVLLEKIKKMMQKLPDGAIGKKFLMLDNWNEWDEGHYLLPSYEFGFQYLEAIREVFTKRDNLPDYRLPQELGTKPINSQWGEPDLSRYNYKKLK